MTATTTGPVARVARYLPGVALALAVALPAVGLNRVMPMVSPLLVAMVVGIVGGNLMGTLPVLSQGRAFCAKTLLRWGIVLLGLQMSVAQVLEVGWRVIIVIVAAVAITFVVTVILGRLLGLSRHLTLLIASGTSICGAAAVAACSQVVDAEEEETANALAVVVVFGTAMIATVACLSSVLGLTPRQAGIWAGVSVHEVAQVVAIGGIVGGGALGVAVMVKLARVVLLAPVMMLLAAGQNRSAGEGQRTALVPWFVLGFVISVAVTTWGLVPPAWLPTIRLVQTTMLSMAMFALGVGVRWSLLKAAGAKPFLLGALAAATAALVGLAGVVLIG